MSCKKGQSPREHKGKDLTIIDTSRVLEVCSSRSCSNMVRKPIKRKDNGNYRYFSTCQQCNNYKHKYGLKPSEVLAMKVSQGNKCGICNIELVWNNTDYNAAAIDHDHTTGRIRGLLCFHCNRALGLFKDDAYILKCAVTYLEDNYDRS